jgi:hypothetical protein
MWHDCRRRRKRIHVGYGEKVRRDETTRKTKI